MTTTRDRVYATATEHGWTPEIIQSRNGSHRIDPLDGIRFVRDGESIEVSFSATGSVRTSDCYLRVEGSRPRYVSLYSHNATGRASGKGKAVLGALRTGLAALA